MLSLKKTAVAVFALGSSTLFAGTMGPVCTPGNVTLPCERQAWDFGVQALYLQASDTAAWDYNGLREVDSGSPANAFTDFRYIDIDQKWNWGFQLEGSYHFSTGNDLTVNWYHIQNNNDDFGAPGSIGNTQFTSLFPFSFPISTGPQVFSYKPKWDAVNVEFGQHVDFSEHKKIRFHAGLQFARLDNSFAGTTSIVRIRAPQHLTYLGTGNSKFNGVGPRIGADMAYHFGNGFSIFGKGASALLVGTSKYNEKQVIIGTFNTPTPPTMQTLTVSGSKRAIVPEFEGKLGAEYAMNMASGELMLSAGYMVVGYIHSNDLFLMRSLKFVV